MFQRRIDGVNSPIKFIAFTSFPPATVWFSFVSSFVTKLDALIIKINDFFIPFFTGVDENTYLFRIFDRWGNKIFETNNVQKGPDGKANGGQNVAQTDVYVWRASFLDINEKKHNFVGHINLIR